MKQTVCDHCGRPLSKYEYVDINITISGYEEKADLCGECLGELMAMVERFIDGGDQSDR